MLTSGNSAVPPEVEDLMRAAPVVADLPVSSRSPGGKPSTKEQIKQINARNPAVERISEIHLGLEMTVKLCNAYISPANVHL